MKTTKREGLLRQLLGLESSSYSPILKRALFEMKGLPDDAWFTIRETGDYKYGRRPIRQREHLFETVWYNIGCRMRGPGTRYYVFLGVRKDEAEKAWGKLSLNHAK